MKFSLNFTITWLDWSFIVVYFYINFICILVKFLYFFRDIHYLFVWFMFNVYFITDIDRRVLFLFSPNLSIFSVQAI